MSNNINRIRKNKLKGTGIFAAAALTAALIAGNNVPGVIRQVNAAESQENTVSSLIPDNITLDKPVELADVELPATEYGTFEWADGSFVPAQRVQSCEVLLIPAEGQDLSHVDGWDPESGAVVGYINVIVNSITDGDDADKTEGSDKTDPTENADPTETPETSSEKPAADENADTDNKEDKESKSDQDNKTDTDNEENKIEEDKTDNKNILFEITDSNLIEKTGGIEGKLKAVLEANREELENEVSFVTESEALNQLHDKTLVIMVDHHNIKQSNGSKVLEQAKNVAVIDHHRRSTEMGVKPIFLYIEAGASSACELITELIPYVSSHIEISELAATIMLTGMTIDTNHFVVRTGARTYDAASTLRRMGADPQKVNDYLKDSYSEFALKSSIISFNTSACPPFI